ncbi:MAG: adenosylcobinamide-phosphate synthase CbiB [Xanthobacteraceae bacterium]
MLPWSDTLIVVLVALAADAAIGDPDWLWRRVPHPVAIIGHAIAALDHTLNRETWSPARRKFFGIVTISLLVAAALFTGYVLEALLSRGAVGNIALGIIASTLIAQNSLYRHVARVRAAFASGGLMAARAAVSRIVGRDPRSLDEGGVSRAAIESCAENFSDGVVAPTLWLVLLGLPGLLAYKAINTADSMIGHRSDRHRAFGWAAARLDDLVNLAPARLSGLLLALAAPLAGGSIGVALKAMLRNARNHRSPNAGWPESAIAGALGIRLAGPRRYSESVVDDPWLNAAGRNATPADIFRALRMLAASCALQFAAIGALACIA